MKYIIDHDLHCHTRLSLCSADPDMTPAAILEHAQKLHYTRQAITDHFWDESLPMDVDWYQIQNSAHIRQDHPLPSETGDVRLMFGCETEIDWHGVVGISRAHMDDYDFIVIPPNHLHLTNVTCPGQEHTPENLCRMFTERLELLTKQDYPWHKIGIAHLNFLYDSDLSRQALDLMDPDRMKEIFRDFARKGVGIELNSHCFVPEHTNWTEYPDSHLKLFYIARDAGCKFYCGSDCHKFHILNDPAYSLETCLRPVIDRLELTEDDKFIPE